MEKFANIEESLKSEQSGSGSCVKIEPLEVVDFINNDQNDFIKTENEEKYVEDIEDEIFEEKEEDNEEDDDFFNYFTPQLSLDEKPAIKNNHHCKYCKKSFPEEKTLNNHCLKQHRKKLTPEQVTEIRRKNRLDRTLVCFICGLATPHLNEHMNMSHLNTKRFFCDQCDYKSFRRCEMRLHMFKHEKQQNFQCDMCGVKFARKNSIFTHMKNVHTSAGPLTCCFCKKQCRNKIALWQHKKILHSNMAGVKEKCKFCDKEILIMYMRKHVRQIHENKGDEMQLCNVCGKTFSKKAMAFHKRIHKDRKFICKYPSCPRKYLTEGQLAQHQKTHLNQREYKCTYAGCSKGYFIPRLLKMHIAITHENFREPCPVPGCKFSVGRRDYMRHHVAKHTELGKDLVESLLEEVKLNTTLW